MIWTDCYKELVEIIRNKDGFLASIPDEYSELKERMENTPVVSLLLLLSVVCFM